METKMGKNWLIAGLVLLSTSVQSQKWIELDLAEKEDFVKSMKTINSGEGCHHFVYRVHNFDLQSTPVERREGFQCIGSEVMISYTEGDYLNYGDHDMSIIVDSVAQELYVGFNLQMNDIQQRGPAAVKALLEENGTIKRKAQNEKNRRTYRIESQERNGIDYYELITESEVLNEFRIFFEETKQERFQEEPEVAQPIVVIEFERASKSEFHEKMMTRGYYLTSTDEGLMPSDNYKGFKVYDSRRILPQ